MQRLLERHPEADLQVVAVWMPMLVTDSPQRVGRVLDDPRVANVWDPEKAAGRRLAARLSGRRGLFVLGGVLWDSYVLFGPDGRLLDVAGPIGFHTDRLAARLGPWLNGSRAGS